METAEAKVPVGTYTRNDGTQVSEHARRPPSEKRSRAKGDDDDDAKGGGDEAQLADSLITPTADATPAEPKKARPTMTVQQFLNMPWQEQQLAMRETALSKADGEAEGLMALDDHEQAAMAANAARVLEGTDPAQGRQGEEMGTYSSPQQGFAEFMRALDTSGDLSNPHRADIVKNAKMGLYHRGGQWGTKSLVPHLFKAGMSELAQDVMAMKYNF